MMRNLAVGLGLSLIFFGGAAATEPVDLSVIAAIKMEGFQRSQVMETAFFLTEVHGPRLHGTPSLLAAAEWSRDRLAEWGLENAHLEGFDSNVPSWLLEGYSVELIEPRYMRLNGQPVVWTPATAGVVTGIPMLVEVASKDDFETYRGKLRGAIVLNSEIEPPPAEQLAAVRRFGDERLGELMAAIDPGKPTDYWQEKEDGQEELDKWREIARFFHQEGVAALLIPSSRDNGVVRVTSSGWEKADENAPTFVLSRESWNMVARLREKGFEPRLRLESRVRIEPDAKGYNVIAEIPGHDPRLKDEVVMLGGHLDAWHAGAGATDNAAGCAVSMEAVRILQAIGSQPRRTIRVALWDGEELDYGGSVDYVARHFANLETLELEPAHARLSAYFNLDSGTGKIRGVYLQGNEAVRPIFRAWLEPFEYLGAETLTAENTDGTDHLLFDAVGLPGFTFIQDPMDYSTLTHHTDLDLYDHLSEPDLKQASVIMASFIYHAAMRGERLPRKLLPAPRSEPAPLVGETP